MSSTKNNKRPRLFRVQRQVVSILLSLRGILRDLKTGLLFFLSFFFSLRESFTDICFLDSVLWVGREMRTSDGLWEERSRRETEKLSGIWKQSGDILI